MSYKEQYYGLVGKLKIEGLKAHLEKRRLRFDDIYQDYAAFRREEDAYNRLVEQLKTDAPGLFPDSLPPSEEAE